MIHPYNYKEPIPNCPICGYELKDKLVRTGTIRTRRLEYEICTNPECKYKHLHTNEKERAIENGVFDRIDN